MKSAKLRILDNVFNLGFLHGLGGLRCITTLSLINNLSEYEDFDKEEGNVDLLIEYEDGFLRGLDAKDENLIREFPRD